MSAQLERLLRLRGPRRGFDADRVVVRGAEGRIGHLAVNYLVNCDSALRQLACRDLPHADQEPIVQIGLVPASELIRLAKVYGHFDQPLRDALDLFYLTGQRIADTLKMDERDIRDGKLAVRQGKTGAKRRIEIIGELKVVIDRIMARKSGHKIRSTRLVVMDSGQPMTPSMLRKRFDDAREAAGIPKAEFQMRDLRAKAATDKEESTGNIREARDQLGHTTVGMTEQYIRMRKGKKVTPTK